MGSCSSGSSFCVFWKGGSKMVLRSLELLFHDTTSCCAGPEDSEWGAQFRSQGYTAVCPEFQDVLCELDAMYNGLNGMSAGFTEGWEASRWERRRQQVVQLLSYPPNGLRFEFPPLVDLSLALSKLRLE